MATTEGKPKDTRTVITRTPKVAFFILKEDGNEKYEEFLLRLEKEEIEPSSSSGIWYNGEYRVQAHYFELDKKEEPTPDADFETTASEKDKESEKEDTDKKSDEEKDEEKDTDTVNIRKDVIHFDGRVGEKKKESDEDKDEEFEEKPKKESKIKGK